MSLDRANGTASRRLDFRPPKILGTASYDAMGVTSGNARLKLATDNAGATSVICAGSVPT